MSYTKKQYRENLKRCRLILEKYFKEDGAKNRFDIDAKIYTEDLFDDLKFIEKNLTPKAKILDIGCGKGHISYLLSSMGYDVEAVDLIDSTGEGGKFNKESLGSKWQEKVWQEFSNESKMNFQFYDGVKIPFPDNHFDGVNAYAVIEHVDDPQLFLKEVRRILKPKGKLFIFRCPQLFSFTENLAKWLNLPSHELLYSKQALIFLLEKYSLKPEKIIKYDTVPAFFPIASLQTIWNKFFLPLTLIRKMLSVKPLNFFAHHFRVVATKK